MSKQSLLPSANSPVSCAFIRGKQVIAAQANSRFSPYLYHLTKQGWGRTYWIQPVFSSLSSPTSPNWPMPECTATSSGVSFLPISFHQEAKASPTVPFPSARNSGKSPSLEGKLILTAASLPEAAE